MASIVHCHYCFDVLTSHLEDRPSRTLAELEALVQAQKELTPGVIEANGRSSAAPTVIKTPLFVTWKKKAVSTGQLDLRGCIGTFEAKPLESGLKDYALTAGLMDSRFEPISARELPCLECGVTLLTDFEPAADPMDWTLGGHGIQIEFVYHHRRMGATYLPDVPAEQGWTKEETIISLMRKAGWTGMRDEWKNISLKVTRYQGSKATVSWQEYQDLLKLEDGAILLN